MCVWYICKVCCGLKWVHVRVVSASACSHLAGWLLKNENWRSRCSCLQNLNYTLCSECIKQADRLIQQVQKGYENKYVCYKQVYKKPPCKHTRLNLCLKKLHFKPFFLHFRNTLWSSIKLRGTAELGDSCLSICYCVQHFFTKQNNTKKYRLGATIAQMVERAPHVQRLCPHCSGPGAALHVILPCLSSRYLSHGSRRKKK